MAYNTIINEGLFMNLDEYNINEVSTNSRNVVLPTEIIDECDPLDLKIYCKLVQLAKSEDEEMFLPSRKEMGRLINCGEHQYDDSLIRLHELGFIIITNLTFPGKRTRRRVIVKYISQRAVILNDETIQELIEKKNKGTLHNIYNKSSSKFPPELQELKKSCIPLQNIPDQELYDLSNQASYQEIGIAILEISNYNKQLKNPRGIFRSRFVCSNGGSGKLNPYRPNPLWRHKSRTMKALLPASQEELKSKCRFYPVPEVGYTDFHIDTICKKLNEREYVPTDFIPIKQLGSNRGILTEHPSEPYRVKLSDSFELVKIRPGFWTIKALDVRTDERRSECKRAKKIGETIKTMMNERDSSS